MPKGRFARQRRSQPEQRQRQEQGRIAPGEARPDIPALLQDGGTHDDAFGEHARFLAMPEATHPANSGLRAQFVRRLQRAYGNSYVQRLVSHVQGSSGGSEGVLGPQVMGRSGRTIASPASRSTAASHLGRPAAHSPGVAQRSPDDAQAVVTERASRTVQRQPTVTNEETGEELQPITQVDELLALLPEDLRKKVESLPPEVAGKVLGLPKEVQMQLLLLPEQTIEDFLSLPTNMQVTLLNLLALKQASEGMPASGPGADALPPGVEEILPRLPADIQKQVRGLLPAPPREGGEAERGPGPEALAPPPGVSQEALAQAQFIRQVHPDLMEQLLALRNASREQRLAQLEAMMPALGPVLGVRALPAPEEPQPEVAPGPAPAAPSRSLRQRAEAFWDDKVSPVVNVLDFLNNVGPGGLVGGGVGIAVEAGAAAGSAATAFGVASGIFGIVFGAIGLAAGTVLAIDSAIKESALKKLANDLEAKGSDAKIVELARYAQEQKRKKKRGGATVAAIGGAAVVAGALGLVGGPLAIAGIVLGVAAAAAGIGLLVYRWWHKRKKRQERAKELWNQATKADDPKHQEGLQAVQALGMDPGSLATRGEKQAIDELAKRIDQFEASVRGDMATRLVEYLNKQEGSRERAEAEDIAKTLSLDPAKLRAAGADKAKKQVMGKLSHW